MPLQTIFARASSFSGKAKRCVILSIKLVTASRSLINQAYHTISRNATLKLRAFAPKCLQRLSAKVQQENRD
jgi:hypothetical protein